MTNGDLLAITGMMLVAAGLSMLAGAIRIVTEGADRAVGFLNR